MKKSSKPIPSPAPATRAPAPLPKLAANPATKTRPEPAPTAKPPASRLVPAPAAPAPRATASLTVINAKVDVGFGNSLYVRGEGPGLSWNKGLAMNNVSSELWTISLPRAARPIVFKFLVNDETWSGGEDFQADPGSVSTLSPQF